MALIIEDGTGVAGANSYVTLSQIRAYAEARGYELPAVDAELEAMAIRAMDYLEGRRADYQGYKTDPAQDLQWPRTDVLIDCAPFPSDKIPVELKNAQCQLCIEQLTMPDLEPSTDGYAIASEKVDVIQVEYATGGRLSGSAMPAQPDYPKVDALLYPLFFPCGSIFPLKVRRA